MTFKLKSPYVDPVFSLKFLSEIMKGLRKESDHYVYIKENCNSK